MASIGMPLLLVAVAGVSATQCESHQLHALQQLYKATAGPNWIHTWNLSTDCCSWYGVECTNGTVSKLSLARNQLSGYIPDSLSSLSQLSTLNLAQNSLGGTLPQNFASLSSLVYLGVYQNWLSGVLPPNLTLSSMVELYTYLNRISGTLPPIAGATGLKAFGMRGNRYSGSIPSSLSGLTSLQLLWLFNTEISGAAALALQHMD